MPVRVVMGFSHDNFSGQILAYSKCTIHGCHFIVKITHILSTLTQRGDVLNTLEWVPVRYKIESKGKIREKGKRKNKQQ